MSAPLWQLSHRADPKARRLADRHYNRQSVGAVNFCPPGRAFVLWRPGAVWVTSWPFAEFTKHEWAGAWVNSLFRNESEILSSALITAAVSHTRWKWPAPDLGMVTFVDRGKTRPKKDPGYCYLCAGFVECGTTKKGLIALRMSPDTMPSASAPMHTTPDLWDRQ